MITNGLFKLKVQDLLTGNENVELVAMADVFEDHLEGALKNLRDPKYLSRHAGIVVERDGKPKEMSAQDLATINANNQASALSSNCVRCSSFAGAYQIIYASHRPKLTPRQIQSLNAVRYKLMILRFTGLNGRGRAHGSPGGGHQHRALHRARRYRQDFSP